jgi:hypothetical protein
MLPASLPGRLHARRRWFDRTPAVVGARAIFRVSIATSGDVFGRAWKANRAALREQRCVVGGRGE